MAISKDLFLALMSLDSYNRGYGAGIEGLGGAGTQIGNATILNVALPGASQTTGFYASAYSLNSAVGDLASGSKIISYRGTNADSIGPALQDIAFGWVTGAGLGAAQAIQAAEFYTAVTGQSIHAGVSANTVLTGHSLGGGLAGYVSALTGTQGVGYDHMPFGAAVTVTGYGDSAGLHPITETR
jgi:hypothetical protein